MSAARDIEDRAALWLLRSEEPDWSPADQTMLDAWLADSLAHKAAYWRLQHGWREADRIRALGAGARVGRFRLPSHLVRRRLLPLAVAASLVAAIGIATVPLWHDEPVSVAQARFVTPVGGRRFVPLSDGSKIELNTATQVRTAISNDMRDVWLDRGEAYFEVAHLEGRPFTVHAGSRTVTVLGTRFSVRRDGDRVTVSVVQGRVRVADARRGGGSSIIVAGDTAIARGPAMLLATRSEERVENALAWRDGMLNFDQTTLRDAAAEFNRYNRKSITIADPAAADIRIGGTFQASNVDAFVRLLRDAYGLHVDDDSEGVKISS